MSLFLAFIAGCASWDTTADVMQEPHDLDTGSPMDSGEEDGPCGEEGCVGGILVDLPNNSEQALCVKFSEVSSQTNLTSSAAHLGVDIVDFDQDGLQDVFILSEGGQSKLMRNLGGSYEDATSEVGLTNSLSLNKSSWHDFNGDGKLDVAIAGEEGSAIYIAEGDGFRELDVSAATAVTKARGVAWLNSGFLFATENGTRFLEYTGDDKFENQTSEKGLVDYSDGSDVAVADFDGDGYDDAFVTNIVGINRLFRHVPESATYESADEQIEQSDNPATAASWEVMDGQSLPDLSIANWDGGNEQHENYDGEFIDAAAELGIHDAGNSTALGWGRLHSDLDKSLYIGRFGLENLLMAPIYNGGGEVMYYENIAQAVGVDANEETMGIAWTDYDGNKDENENEDIVQVTYDGHVRLYQNDSKLIDLCAEEE
jgi:hypothetical protein